MNPHDILGVPPRRTMGLYAVLTWKPSSVSPERHPERFTAISEAYQALKDEKSRLHYELFDMEPGVASPMEAVVRHFAWSERRTPLILKV